VIQINFTEEQLEVLKLTLIGFVASVEDSEFDSNYTSSDDIKTLNGIKIRISRALSLYQSSERRARESK